MAIKIIFPFIIAFTLGLPLLAQDGEGLRLTPNELPGVSEKRWSTYNEDQLWGYINGGADIYLEYGFDEVTAQDITWQGETIKVDAYRMTSPLAAFGIFSISRYSCNETGVISAWDCIGRQQVQAVLGNLYLSVISYSGSEAGVELAKQIAHKIAEKYKSNTFSIPKILTDSEINPNLNKIKFIAGQLAVQNAFPSFESVFESLNDYMLWVVPFDVDGVEQTLLLMEFSTEVDCALAKMRICEKMAVKTNYILQERDNRIMLVQSKEGEIDSEKLSKLISFFKNWDN